MRIFQNNKEYDFWSKLNKVGRPVTIMASSRVQNEFEEYLAQHEIIYEIEIDNVAK